MDEDDLAKYPGLYERDGVWWVRKRVPADLRHVDPQWQVRRSLGTSDFKTAVRLYHAKLAKIVHGFEQQRADLGRHDKVTKVLLSGKLEQLSREEIDRLVSGWWEQRTAARHPIVDDFELHDTLETIEHDLRELDASRHEEADAVADRLLVDAGMVSRPRKVGTIVTATRYPQVDRTTDQYGYLRDRVRAGLETEAKLARDFLTGERSAAPETHFNSANGTPSSAALGGSDGRLKDLIAAFKSERVALYGEESTNRKYGLLIRVLEDVIGADLPVSSLRREHCVQVLSFLQTMPPNATKRFRKLSLREARDKAEREGLRGMAPNTVGSYMQNLTAILNWAEAGGWACQVSTKGLVRSREPIVQRRGFEPDELKRVFADLLGYRRSQPTKFWVPALALFTGARAGEICQLRREDVVKVGEVDCLNLTVFDAKGRRVAGKRLKTASSERYVPLHPDLLAADFIRVVEDHRMEGRLFPDLPPGPSGNHSHAISSWFGRYLDRVGLSDPSLVFHSFRHGFRDACRDADIAEETAMALGGWSSINQATKYGDRGRVPNLHRAITKIAYGDFRLT